ncbi:splicing factor [Chytridiales sp. JEL 0842]|nr:splicing factor [Chytridiales sp. JEL 0842]
MSIAEQRKLLEALMGGGSTANLHFTDPKICRSFLCGMCPHDLFTNTKVDLGACPKSHSEKLKKDYEAAVKRGEHPGFQDEWARNLASYVSDCDRKIDNARRRIEKGPEDAAAAQLVKEVDDLNKEIGALTAQVEKLGEEGSIDESLRMLRQVEDLQRVRVEREKELKAMSLADASSTHQKLRVCDSCGAYLSIFDSDRRLADHFQGKMHLGFKQLREQEEELRKKGFGQTPAHHHHRHTQQRDRKDSYYDRDADFGPPGPGRRYDDSRNRYNDYGGRRDNRSRSPMSRQFR